MTEEQQKLPDTGQQQSQAKEVDFGKEGDMETGRPPKPEFKILTPATIDNIKYMKDDAQVKEDRKGGKFNPGYLQVFFKLEDGTQAADNYSLRYYPVKDKDGKTVGTRVYFGSDKAQMEAYAHALRKLALETFGDVEGVNDSISATNFGKLLCGKKVMVITDPKSVSKKIVVRQFIR